MEMNSEVDMLLELESILSTSLFYLTQELSQPSVFLPVQFSRLQVMQAHTSRYIRYCKVPL
jgi:hypothetical protein